MMSKKFPRTAACSAVLLLPLAALADSTVNLDSVVVTGSRIEHSSFDLPAAVDVVDGSRLNTAQARVNASEVLAGVPGLLVQNRQNYAQDLQISSRGFGARTAFGVRGIRLVADGIPVSMPDGQGQAATFNLDRAERIEVMRGPLSAIYGNAAGGVIQLFTRNGSGTPKVDTQFTAGSFGSWKADLGAEGEQGGIAYLIDTSRFATDGYRDHSAATRDQSMVKLGFSPNGDARVTFVANAFKQQADDPLGLSWSAYQANPRSVDPVANQFNTRKTIDHLQGGVNFEQRLGEHTLQLSAYAGQRATVQYQAIPTNVQANARHAGGVIDFERSFSGLSGRWSTRRDWAGGQLTSTLGVDYEQSSDDRRGYQNFIGSTLGVEGALRRNEEDRVASFDQYAQLEWQGQRWTFNGGLRHSRVNFAVDDRYIVGLNGNDSGRVQYEKTTPTLGAMVRLTQSLNLYASAARGFETPSLNELFYSGAGGTFSFSLRPSTSTHLETGLKAMVGDNSRIDLAVFDVQTNDELVVDSSSGGRTSYRNAGKTQRQGVELGADTRWAGGFSGRLAFTALRATFEEAYVGSGGAVAAGNRLPGVPARQLYGELAWKHPATGFYAGLEAVGRDRLQVDDTNTRQPAPGYAIANLRVGIDREIGQAKVGAFARVDNVLDRQYVGSVIVGDTNQRFYESAPGRAWLVGVTLRYAL